MVAFTLHSFKTCSTERKEGGKSDLPEFKTCSTERKEGGKSELPEFKTCSTERKEGGKSELPKFSLKGLFRNSNLKLLISPNFDS